MGMTAGSAKATGKLKADDADEGRPPKGGPSHRNVKANRQDIPRADGHDGADAGDGQQARRDIEDNGKPHGRQRCGDSLRAIDAVRYDVVRRIGRNLTQADGPDDAEGHGQDDEHRVHGPGHARYDIIVHEVVKGIDEGYARHEKQHAGDHGKPRRIRSRQDLRPIGRRRRDTRRRSDADVGIDAEAVAAVAHPESDTGCQSRIGKGNPVAAEQFAEPAAGNARRQRRRPLRIVAAHTFFLHSFQVGLKGPRFIFLFQSPPGQLADVGNRRHVDAVNAAFPKHRIRLLLAIVIGHNRRISHVEVQMLPVQP